MYNTAYPWKVFTLSLYIYIMGIGFPGGSEVKSVCLQCGRPGFNPWVRKIPWRRKWQPTPAILPGESHVRRSLVGYSPLGRKESWIHIVVVKSLRFVPVFETSWTATCQASLSFTISSSLCKLMSTEYIAI